MKDGYKNFYCGLCKQSKTKAERQKIILYNVEDNELLSSDLCKNDFQN